MSKVSSMFSQRRPLRLAALFCFGLLSVSTGAAPAISWKSSFYNPKPLADDVVLPLPCGGAMTFRRVNVPADGPLSDLRIDLGASDGPWGYAENTLARYIAGSFQGADTPSYVLMGKYEVSQLQYQAVSQNECPQPSMKLRLPQGRMSWFDAVKFTNDWSLWLLQHAPEQLPKSAGKTGFVRLPTEVEWEYAARGGAQVSIADFRERVFPMAGGMSDYVWFAGSKSANGKPQLTGLLSPNPLGLHDILGNLDEITLEPFQLNHLDRLHGQVGGYVVRGGNYFTEQQEIRVAYRKEMPHFNDEGAFRAKTTGFRVILSAPVIISPARLEAIQAAWKHLGKAENQQPAPNKPATAATESAELAAIQEDPADEIEILTAAVDNKQVKQRLQRLGYLLRAAQEEELQQRKRAARASLRMGGVICQQLGKDALVVEIRRQKNHKFCSDNSDGARLFSAEECSQRLQTQKLEEGRYIHNLGLYADSVIEVARSYQADELKRFGPELLRDLTETSSGKVLADFVKIYQAQTTRYGEDWRVQRETWAEACKAEVVAD